MPTSSPAEPRSAPAGRTVSAPYIVTVIMSMATPMTVFTGIVVIGYAETGLTGQPAAFLAAGLLMSLFYAAYTRMAPLVGNPGSFSGYIAHGLGRIAGVGGAMIALLSYAALLWGLYGFVATPAAPLARKWLGWDLPWPVFALLAWALVAWVGHRRVRSAARVVAVLLGLELTAIVAFSVTNLLHPAGGVITFETLSIPKALATPGFGALLALAVLGFVGIEGVVTFAKECVNPGRTVPLAAQVTIAGTMLLYAGGTWLLSVATGPDGIVSAARQHGADLVFDLALPHLGETVVDLGRLLLVTSVVAAMIGFHGAGSRYLLSLGKEHVLPRWLGNMSPLTGAPVAASRVQSGVALLVILVYALIDVDPAKYLFYWGGAGGALGVLVLMTMTAWSTVLYFVRKARDTPLLWWVIAIAAAIGVSWMLGQVWSHFPLVLGEAPGSLPSRVIPLLLGGAAAIGIFWGVWLRVDRPEVYQAIGLGGPREIDRDQGVDDGPQRGDAAPTGTTAR